MQATDGPHWAAHKLVGSPAVAGAISACAHARLPFSNSPGSSRIYFIRTSVREPIFGLPLLRATKGMPARCLPAPEQRDVASDQNGKKPVSRELELGTLQRVSGILKI
jgi:hypothetical protein